METFWQDLRYAFRLLIGNRNITIVSVVMLALGIGANTAIFTVVNSLLLRPLPYPDSDRLVMVSINDKSGSINNTGYATYTDWKQRNRSFEEISVIRFGGGTLTGQGEAEMIDGVRVSANYFRMLGVNPALGRDFRVEEDKPDTRFVIILSHSLWQRRFGADPQIVGKQISLTGKSYTVVGVMPRNFEDRLSANFYQQAEVWAPLGYDVSEPWACRNCQHLKAVARVKTGVSLDQADAEIKAITASILSEHPKEYALGTASITRLQDRFVGEIRSALYILLAAVGFVLLIACANVANLLLARATQRQKEMAIRLAIGASRLRIVRQLLTESLLLSFLGAGLGLLLSMWCVELLTSLSPTAAFKLTHIGIDWRVLVFTAAISILTGLLFGTVPALQAMKQDVQLALKDGGRSSAGARQRRLRGMLAVSEIALALSLMVGAGLLIKSFAHLLDVTPGFEAKNLLTMAVPAVGARYGEEAGVRAFYRDLLERAEAIPGVESAGIVSNLPFGGNMDTSGFHVEEKPYPNPADAPSAERYSISPDYLRAMRIPLLRGRGFTEQDGPNAPLVALINETAAKRIWPNEDPIGKRIRLGGPEDPLRTIVGIVGDVNHYGLDTPPDMQTYLPHSQWTDQYMRVVIRASSEPAALTAAVRQAVQTVDKDVPVYEVSAMEQLISKSVGQRRFTLALLGLFAAIALLMATIGIYSVISYSVTQRTHEIGIRIALGAERRDILKLVIGQGLFITISGIAIGLMASYVLTRLMKSLLYGVDAADSATFALVALLLACVSLAACCIPARRAAKVDPIIALRCE